LPRRALRGGAGIVGSLTGRTAPRRAEVARSGRTRAGRARTVPAGTAWAIPGTATAGAA
jgi:hypothetical protein